jgi:hypothetical protein
MVALAEAESFASLCGLVAGAVGGSAVDFIVGKHLSALGPRHAPVRGAIDYELGAFCPRHRGPSILPQSFLSILIDTLGPLKA